MRDETPAYIQDAINRYSSLKTLFNHILSYGGSETTAINYVDGVRDFAARAKSDPDALLRKKTDWVKAIDDYVTDVGATGVSTNTVSMTVRSMKKWLTANHAVPKARLADIEPVKVKTVEKDRTPTREELQSILSGSDLLERVIVLVAVSTGIRLRAITYLRFSQILGLELRAGPTMEVRVHRKNAKGVYRPVMARFQSKELVLSREIPLVRIQTGTNKVRRSHFTFLTPEAVAALKAYVVERQTRGEVLAPDSYLVVTTAGKRRMSIATVEERWRGLLETARLTERSPGGRVRWYKLHFHTIRSYFTSACVLNGIEKEAAKFFRGDKGGTLQGYVMKRDDEEIPKATIEKAEELYRKALPDLTMTSDVRGAELQAMGNEVKEAMLMTWLPPEEVKKLGDLSKLNRRDATRLVNEWRVKQQERPMGQRREHLPDVYYDIEQKTIFAEDFERWNKEGGWQWRRDLPGGKMIIGLPAKRS